MLPPLSPALAVEPTHEVSERRFVTKPPGPQGCWVRFGFRLVGGALRVSRQPLSRGSRNVAQGRPHGCRPAPFPFCPTSP